MARPAPGVTYPEPTHRLTGTDRPGDWLLNLDDEAVAGPRRAVGNLTMNIMRACQVGAPAPIVQDMYERLTNPQPGDYVVEVSAMHRADRAPTWEWHQGVGVLLGHRDEWWHSHADWEALVAADEWGPGDRPIDHAWYVQYGPGAGDVCRWVNCNFYMIPVELIRG